MNHPLSELSFPLFKEPEMIVWIPARVSNPLSQEVGFIGNVIAVIFFSLNGLFYLLSQFLGNPLISINIQCPFSSRLLQSEVLLPSISHPFLLEYLTGIFFSNLDCLITGKGINDDDLIRPLHTLQTILYILFFVLSDNDYRELNHSFPHSVDELMRLCVNAFCIPHPAFRIPHFVFYSLISFSIFPC